MLYTGMIFQFNNEEGSGLIMLSDGEKREFRINDWVDESNEPAIGQKIAYDDSSDGVKIKVLNQEDELLSQQVQAQEKTSKEEQDEVFTSIDEYIKHFKDEGFKLVNDFSNENSRRAMLRKFSVDKHEEVKLQLIEGEIVLIKSLNGKKID